MSRKEKAIAKEIERILKYKDHQAPEQRCELCSFSYVTNPGASTPGLACKIMDAMGTVAGDEFAHCQIHEESICQFYK